MAVEEGIDVKRGIRKNILKVAKAAVKAVIVFVIYILLVNLLTPVSALIPGLQEMIRTFVTVYVVLMVIGDLTSGTIVQHFFNGAKALFVVAYLILSLNSGILDYTLGNLNLIIDVRIILVVATLLGLVGIAKSILQAIDYANQKAELTIV